MTQTVRQPTETSVPPAADPAFTRWPRLVQTLRVFACAMFTTGLVFLVVAFVFGDWHWALAASTFFGLWGHAVTVLCIEALMASRAKYYEHGELAGWYRGWNGQPPEVTNSVLSQGR